MKRFLLAILLLLPIVAMAGPRRGGPGTYIGPGDVVSGATVFWGLRAYNAQAAGTQAAAIEVQRASDNTTMVVHVLPWGALNIAAANTFAGTDATCTGSISGTALSVSSCTGTLHVNDTLTGAGIAQPSYITAIGTCASPPGTCTVNATQSVGSESITAQVSLSVPVIYDQTGHGFNATPSTTSAVLLPSCLNGLPCLTDGLVYNSPAGDYTPSTGIVSFEAIFDRADSAQNGIDRMQGGNNGILRFNSLAFTANAVFLGGPTLRLQATAADSAWHTAGAVLNTTSSVVNVDGTETTGSVDTSTANGNLSMAAAGASGPGSNDFWTESILWDNVVPTSTQRANLCHNGYQYWGTSVSC